MLSGSSHNVFAAPSGLRHDASAASSIPDEARYVSKMTRKVMLLHDDRTHELLAPLSLQIMGLTEMEDVTIGYG
jgi:hypothetical protein